MGVSAQGFTGQYILSTQGSGTAVVIDTYIDSIIIRCFEDVVLGCPQLTSYCIMKHSSVYQVCLSDR